jgi:hypothetical protein
MTGEPPEIPPHIIAAADQLDARHRDHKEQLRREYRDGPQADETPLEPLVMWQEGDVWCAVARGPLGALCGYARVPDEHPWAAIHYDEPAPGPGVDLEQPAEQAVDDHGAIPLFLAVLTGQLDDYQATLAAHVPCHGGLTYTGPIPIAGAPHGWWLGFDCNHSGDAVDPAWYDTDEGRPHAFSADFNRRQVAWGNHVWTVEEVSLELKRVVTVIAAAAHVES